VEEPFDLPVAYNGEELSFKTMLVSTGYTYSFHIQVEKAELVFEKDDSGDFRVINYTEEHANIDTNLLEAIIISLKVISE
jgi:hypothetical protein